MRRGDGSLVDGRFRVVEVFRDPPGGVGDVAGFGRGWLHRFSQDDGAVDAVGFVAAEIAVGAGEVSQ